MRKPLLNIFEEFGGFCNGWSTVRRSHCPNVPEVRKSQYIRGNPHRSKERAGARMSLTQLEIDPMPCGSVSGGNSY